MSLDPTPIALPTLIELHREAVLIEEQSRRILERFRSALDSTYQVTAPESLLTPAQPSSGTGSTSLSSPVAQLSSGADESSPSSTDHPMPTRQEMLDAFNLWADNGSHKLTLARAGYAPSSEDFDWDDISSGFTRHEAFAAWRACVRWLLTGSPFNKTKVTNV